MIRPTREPWLDAPSSMRDVAASLRVPKVRLGPRCVGPRCVGPRRVGPRYGRLGALAGLLLYGCAGGAAESPSLTEGNAEESAGEESAVALVALAKQRLGSIADLPKPDVDPAWVSLGRRLFFEKGVSADAEVGCVTCHNTEHAGADGLPRSKGVFGRDNPRNAPTVWNVATQYAQHWRADRESVEDQAIKALLGKGSFGLESNEQAVEKLNALPGMPEAFAAAFPDAEQAVSVDNWGKAIGAYERTLRASSAFDAFVEGDASALDAQAQRGLSAFLDRGCGGCHSGPLLGGMEARKFGIHEDYFALTGSEPVDNGRFDVTEQEADRYVFKVPPLRNVAKTAPYFHDGSVSQLSEAVAIMARAQLGEALEDSELQDIVAFLESLDTEIPEGFSAP